MDMKNGTKKRARYGNFNINILDNPIMITPKSGFGQIG